MESYELKTKEVLKTLLKEMGLQTTGTKDILIKRLVSANEAPETDIEPDDSASQVSTNSSSSFIKAQRAVEAAKKAELEARASVLEERRQLLEEELRLKLRQEQLSVQEELAAVNAREQAFAASDALENDNGIVINGPSHQENLPGPSSRGGRADTNIRNETHETQIRRMSEAILRQQQRILLPKTEITKFNGDPMEYPMFIRSFINRIETQTESDAEKLYFFAAKYNRETS